MRKIHAAKSASAVSSVIALARSDVSFVKSSGASDAEVKKALQIINQAVVMGNEKMVKLKQEKQLEAQKASAAKREKAELAKEIKRRQRSREIKETVAILNDREVTISKRMDPDDPADLLSSTADCTLCLDVNANSISGCTGTSVESECTLDVQI